VDTLRQAREILIFYWQFGILENLSSDLSKAGRHEGMELLDILTGLQVPFLLLESWVHSSGARRGLVQRTK
jgi:hypothetical protein